MGEVEEPQFTSLAGRIAALNQAQIVSNARSLAGGKRPPPPPAPKPTQEAQRPQIDKVKTVNNSAVSTQSKPKEFLPPPPVDRDFPKTSPHLSTHKKPPPLPYRRDSQASPSLPPRKPSDQLTVRRGSNDSTLSFASSISAFSMGHASSSGTSIDTGGRKLPPPLDQAILPTLPPSRREIEEKAKMAKQAKVPLISVHSAPAAVPQIGEISPALPPRLPRRTTKTPPGDHLSEAAPANRRMLAIEAAPPPMPQRPARPSAETRSTSSAFLEEEAPPPMPQRPTRPSTEFTLSPSASALPPPIPHASRPSAAQISAGRVRQEEPAIAASGNSCLVCRDFSGPDCCASQYPLSSHPNMTTAYLADVLCSPFSSATDKSRSIFTWLHYNIAYDVKSFFGNNVKHATPEQTLTRGVAVCGGYAGLFEAIARKAGLECIVVTGHGKGINYPDRKDGDPIPSQNPTGHAWNAVKIDQGEWKLIDPCWGAGHVQSGSQAYTAKFSPHEFTCSNEEFFLKHCPANNSHFFLNGRIPSWEEYILGPPGRRGQPPKLFGNVDDYGISRTSFLPQRKSISLSSGSVTRFQFSTKCAHWDHVKNGQGQPYCMILQINGFEGREKDFVPFESDAGSWWVDVGTRHLGKPGDSVVLYAVTSVNGNENVRGMTKQEYLTKKGRAGMGFAGVASWELVQ